MQSGIGMCILIFTIKSPQKALQYSYDPVIASDLSFSFYSPLLYSVVTFDSLCSQCMKTMGCPSKILYPPPFPPFITCQKGNDKSLKRKA